MTYESTGEVREPKLWEHFLMFSPEMKFERRVTQRMPDDCSGDETTKRIIMRPVEEPKTPYTAWSVVIPFGSELGAKEAVQTFFRGWGTTVQEVEIHE